MSPEFCRHCGAEWGEIDPTSGHRKRSDAQNRYLHKEPFPKMAAKFGESVARTKLILMGEFWGYEPCKVTGVLLPVKVHTSEMTVAETTTFIDWLIPWALMEHGVEIDLPPFKEAAERRLSEQREGAGR